MRIPRRAPALAPFLIACLAAFAGSALAKTMDASPFFAEVDTNKDGCASHAERTRAGAPESSYQALKDERGCVTLARMNATEAPEGIDTNGDGKLTLAELKAFDRKMAPLMKKMREEEAAKAAGAASGPSARKP